MRQVVVYRRLKTKENCKLSSLKVVAVAYKRWSLTRDSNYSDLTGEILVFWKSGSSREVVASGGSTVLSLLSLSSRSSKEIFQEKTSQCLDQSFGR